MLENNQNNITYHTRKHLILYNVFLEIKNENHEKSLEPLDYKNNPSLKPPYSYSNLIKMAMKSYDNQCITLINIYDWIKENFAFYKNVDNCWQVYFFICLFFFVEFYTS